MDQKKDLFYDLLANPQLALGDLEAVGHSTENSRLFSKDYYKNNEKVREEFTKEDGSFDEKAFDKQYAVASYYWQGMTNDSYNKNLIQYTAFDKDNIFVDNKYRTLKDAPVISKAPNVTRDTWGLIEVGKMTPSGKSMEEIAQAEKTLLNPVEVENGAEPIWGESPNDEWWSKPFSTRVLAKYDSAGYHIDAVTGEKVWHEKDELKINSNGTHYYEALDGRDIYGRQVLNKFNTLTTDGSWWNQYDFLDSDDLNQKSIAGSVAKNLALVGSMFIPYVGWGIAAASVAQQMTGLAGTFGKMLTGSENSTLSAMEGFSKSWSRSGAKTQYAQQNMMCWENFIDLIGDTTAQLREQRAIFKFAPAILKGKYGAMGKKGQDLFEAEKMAEYKKLYQEESVEQLIKSMYKSGAEPEYIKKVISSQTPYNLMKRSAAKDLENYLSEYNKVGEKIARAYMVGITVGDAYGEAKAAGASDAEAALMTAGYAAMENALLSTNLGRWIFPELKGEKLKYKSIAKAFAGLPEDVRAAATNLRRQDKELTKDWMKRLFNAGKEAAKKDYSLLNKTAGAVLANGIGEGIEEVSEEALADFSKACFNTYRELTGQQVLMDTWGNNWDWNEAAKRYGMSFAGGIIGGSINAAATDFDQIKSYGNMTREQAMEHLTWMARNNELGNFWSTVNKMELGNSKLGTKQNSDGSWTVGTKTDNQDIEVKSLLKGTLDRIQKIVNAEGANLDDASFIGNLIKLNPQMAKHDLLGQLRTDAIAHSTAAGKLVKNYNTLIKDIIKEQQAIDDIYSNLPDGGKPSGEQEAQIKAHTDKLTELRAKKDAILKGELTNDLIRRSLFEATYQLAEGFTTATEYQYVSKQLADQGKSISDLSDEEKEEWHKKYIQYAKSEKADDIEYFADWYWDIAKATSTGLQGSMDYFQQLREDQLPKIQSLQNLASVALNEIQRILINGGDASEVQNYITKLTANQVGKHSRVPDLAESVLNIETSPQNPENIARYQELTKKIKTVSDPEQRKSIQEELQTLEQNDPQIKKFVRDINSTSSVQNSIGSIEKLLLKLEDIFADPKLQMPTTRAEVVRRAVLDVVVNDIFDAVEEAKKIGFIHPEVRNLMKNTLQDMSVWLDDYMDPSQFASLNWAEDISEEITELQDKNKQALQTLEELPNTPIQKILDSFMTSVKAGKNVSTLISDAIKKQEEHASDMENVALNGEPELFEYEQALKILELCRQGIIGARTDNADLGNLFGYNATLNELYRSEPGFVQLAEIDQKDAQYALQDIDLAINRLRAMKDLHAVNSGNKLNAQNHAAVNKSLIMYNRVNRLITSLRDNKEDIAESWGISSLLEVLEKMEIHKRAWGDPTKKPERNVSQRTLGLTESERIQLEKEALMLENAIYDFFNKNSDKVKDPKELAKILDSFNYINKNSGILNKESQDIDDNAFTWWLASKAALKASDFAAVFSRTIDGPDVERPVAPIPTQELGVYAGVAAIFNGDMFRNFANAMTESIYTKWKNMSREQRLEALKKGGLTYYNYAGKLESTLDVEYKDNDYSSIYNSDVIPNYVNTLFIEGIAGSGKSTGVFKSIMKVLFDQDPEVVSGHKLSEYPIFFAHGTKKNADDAVASFEIPAETAWNFRTFDKKALFEHFTDDYKDEVNTENEHQYFLNEDVTIENGRYKSLWKIKKFSNPDKEIPKVMFIDEWSQYTQPEIAFLQQVADKFGIQIIAGGDLDQNTPRAAVFERGKAGSDHKRLTDVTIDRNSFPRMQKLGVSMRTGNGQKTENQNRVRAWKENRSLPIELTHLEIDGQLYGDKVYNQDGEVTEKQLAEIKADIQKMVDSLKPGEKIGYIYHSKDSNIYKLINQEFKDYFDLYSETAAQGREARFYVVENNREVRHQITNSRGQQEWKENNPIDYYRSLYTGITRAEQATIVIAPSSRMGNEQMGIIQVKNAAVQPTKLIPDGYSGAGIKKYTQTRKEGSIEAWNAVKKELGLTEDINTVKLTYVTRTTIEDVPTPITKEKTAASTLDPGTASAAPATTLENIDKEAPAKPKEVPSTGEIGPEPEPEPEPKPEVTGSDSSTEEPSTETPSESEPEEVKSKILPRGTEIYDFRPGMGGRFLGAVESYNEETGKYTLTLDGKDDNYEMPYEDLEQGLKDGFQTMAPEDAKTHGYVGLLALDEVTPYLGKYPIGTEIYDASTNDLIGTISGFNEGIYTITSNSGTQKISASYLEVPFIYSIGKTSIAKYKPGDVIQDQSTKYTVQEVNKLASGGYSYKLQKNLKGVILDEQATMSEQELADLLDLGYTLNPENNLFDEEEVLGIETGSGQEYEKTIEEVLSITESPEEKVELDKNDISFSLLGHTFNTFYTGLDFERAKSEHRPLVPQEGEPGYDRIDMGIGLYKIDPSLCATEQIVTQVLGDIRNAAMYMQENSSLADFIKERIPALKDDVIEIKYAWISKSKERDPNSKYAKENDRFTPADGRLRNMPEGDENKQAKEEIPLKTLSLVIRTKNKADGDLGKSILEIPMITITSPQTLLYKIGKQDSTNPVYQVYIKAANSFGLKPGQQFVAINAVMNYINGETGKTLGKGYKALADLCKLWLYNNDGIRFIDGTEKAEFNFARAFTNLGVKYVKERQVEVPFMDPTNPPKNNYKGKWHDLSKETISRPEVTYSSIMMSTNKYYSSGEGASIEVAAAGHPFVLRWEGSEAIYGTLTDERMMSRYIAQLQDPSLPKLVRLMYVSPPEASISEYLENIQNKENNPYGNSFTAYHILSAIYNYAQAHPEDTLWKGYLQNFSYSGKTLADLEQIIRNLDQVKIDNPKQDGENNAQYLTRLTKLQKEVMQNNVGVVSMMNSALFKLTYPNGINLEGAYRSNINKISQICNAVGITGVLRKKALQEGNPVAGYAYKLKTDTSNKYASPEGRPWRIFSKFDSPTFDISMMINQKDTRNDNIISRWASYAKFGPRGRNPKPGAPSVWYFDGGYASKQKDYYFAGGVNGKTGKQSKAEAWRKKHANLLDKLGLKDDNQFGNSAKNEMEFLQNVADYWISKTDADNIGVGNMAMVIDGKSIFCGNMNDSNTEGTRLPEVYKHLRQASIEKSTAEPNMYLLTMVDDRDGTNYQVKVEILPDSKTYSIYFLEEKAKAPSIEGIPVETLQEAKQTILNWIGGKPNPTKYQKNIAETLEKLYDEYITAANAFGPSITEYQIAQDIKEAFEEDEDTLEDVALAMDKEIDYFEDIESLKQDTEVQEEDNNNEVMWCPIPIGPKNFM